MVKLGIKFTLISAVCLIFVFWIFAAPISRADLVGNTNNATLSFNPATSLYRTNTTVPIDVLVNTHGQNVVVVAAYINYNPNIIDVVSIDTSSSIFTVEAENSIDSVNGRIRITRGTPNPGVNTVSGNVVTLNIRGRTDTAPSSDNFTFDFTSGSTTDSNVILNDGLGTDIISGVYNGRFSFDGTAPANVSNFTATPGSNAINLTWTNPSTDFNGVTILRKTTGYPTGPADGTIVYDNNGTSFSDTGVSAGTTYYYGAYSRDVVLNYSSGVTASAMPLDTSAPAAITTLAASANASRMVVLTWTSVGDDGNVGTATSYDIRHSTSNITVSNWSSATQVTGEPNPRANGNSETMTISNLNGGATYYFAIKAVDEASNAGNLSNVVTFKTYQTADLNRDYITNSVDFGVLMSYWSSATRPPADFNQDGIVNSVDFGIMMSQWGSY